MMKINAHPVSEDRIGIAFYPDHGEDTDILIGGADRVM